MYVGSVTFEAKCYFEWKLEYNKTITLIYMKLFHLSTFSDNIWKWIL